jgi:hypothetical protein
MNSQHVKPIQYYCKSPVYPHVCAMETNTIPYTKDCGKVELKHPPSMYFLSAHGCRDTGRADVLPFHTVHAPLFRANRDP